LTGARLSPLTGEDFRFASYYVGGFALGGGLVGGVLPRARGLVSRHVAFAAAGMIVMTAIMATDGGLRAHDAIDWTVFSVVGDLPPAYLYFEPPDTWQDALEGYVAEMRAWVEAARPGGDVSELIPVNVPPTAEYAEILGSRLDFIRRNLLDVEAESIVGDA
jgi:hypothetical protein